MNKNPRLVQYDGPLGKEASLFSCSYKTVAAAKKAILEDLE